MKTEIAHTWNFQMKSHGSGAFKTLSDTCD